MSVWNSLDRLKTEQEVDVYHTVELIRMIRPQAITDTVSQNHRPRIICYTRSMVKIYNIQYMYTYTMMCLNKVHTL